MLRQFKHWLGKITEITDVPLDVTFKDGLLAIDVPMQDHPKLRQEKVPKQKRRSTVEDKVAAKAAKLKGKGERKREEEPTPRHQDAEEVLRLQQQYESWDEGDVDLTDKELDALYAELDAIDEDWAWDAMDRIGAVSQTPTYDPFGGSEL